MQLETMREIVVLQSFCSPDRRLRRSLGRRAPVDSGRSRLTGRSLVLYRLNWRL